MQIQNTWTTGRLCSEHRLNKNKNECRSGCRVRPGTFGPTLQPPKQKRRLKNVNLPTKPIGICGIMLHRQSQECAAFQTAGAAAARVGQRPSSRPERLLGLAILDLQPCRYNKNTTTDTV